MQDSLDQKELQHFSSFSDTWWDENGPFAPLHAMNPVRLDYIITKICLHFDKDRNSAAPLKGLRILDVGCGGGLICEPLARLGADVTGLDADAQAIDIAQSHASEENLDITYLNTLSDDHLKDNAQSYDIVLGLEIIEHVRAPQNFVDGLIKLSKPKGMVIFSTLNRTAKSFILGIVAAEYILSLLPKGTHNWKSFKKPSELARWVRRSGGRPVDVCGMVYNPIHKTFSLSKTDTSNNYIMTAVCEV